MKTSPRRSGRPPGTRPAHPALSSCRTDRIHALQATLLIPGMAKHSGEAVRRDEFGWARRFARQRQEAASRHSRGAGSALSMALRNRRRDS